MKQLEQCFLCGRKEREFLCKKFNQVAASGKFRHDHARKNILFVWHQSSVSVSY